MSKRPILRRVGLISLLNCLIHNGDLLYLEGSKFHKNNCVARYVWTFLIFLLLLAAIVLSILSSINEPSLKIPCKLYNGVSGLSIIAILTAANFMVFSLFISTKLFSKKYDFVKRQILSLAALVIIYQIILTLICFLDIIFPFMNAFNASTNWIRVGIQTFTIIFMVVTDIHMILHLSPIVISKGDELEQYNGRIYQIKMKLIKLDSKR